MTRGLPSPAAPPAASRFVAVGANGIVLTSSDGANWAEKRSGGDKYLYSVAAGPRGFVAVGEEGLILFSSDGETWNDRSLQLDAGLGHVVWTGSEFVVAGGGWSDGAVLLKSPDGISWEQVDAPEFHMFHAVAYLGRTFLAAAYTRSDLQIPALFSATFTESSAGTAWTQHEGPDFYDSVTVGDEVWVAGRTLAKSRDGVNWQEQTIGGGRSIAHNQGRFLMVSDNALNISADGVSWSSEGAPTDHPLLAAAIGGDSFVATGARGTILLKNGADFWIRTDANTTEDLLDVTYGP